MSDKIYTNCDRCDPERKQPFQFVTFTYRDGKPTYLCDDCLDSEKDPLKQSIKYHSRLDYKVK